jgi:hypothetical protein
LKRLLGRLTHNPITHALADSDGYQKHDRTRRQ